MNCRLRVALILRGTGLAPNFWYQHETDALGATFREVPHQNADKVVCMQSGNGLPPMADIPMGRSEDVVHLGNCKNAFLNEAIEQGRNDGSAN